MLTTRILNVASVTLLRPFSEGRVLRGKQSEKVEDMLWEPITIRRDEVDACIRSMAIAREGIHAKGLQ